MRGPLSHPLISPPNICTQTQPIALYYQHNIIEKMFYNTSNEKPQIQRIQGDKKGALDNEYMCDNERSTEP